MSQAKVNTPAVSPTNQDLFLCFGRIGLLSFGGPAAQIALLQTELVHRRKWLSDKQFLEALSFCMLLPGPEAMQLATWCGWRLRGKVGGLMAGGLFVLPGACVIAALAAAYLAFGSEPSFEAALLGIKAAVVAILAMALGRLAKTALVTPLSRLVAVVSFAGLFLLQLPFAFVILTAGLLGWARPGTSHVPPPPWPKAPATARTLVIWASLWALPLLVLWVLNASDLLTLGAVFAKLALVSFGGAYAVLAYLNQEVVHVQAWLTQTQMLDALGLAETTPGPLILVTQFVGMIAGYGLGGWTMALMAGGVTLWMTFVPSFLFIFAGAPYLTAITQRARPKAALAMISAAVVGVMASLALWFTLHVMFTDIRNTAVGPLSLPLPRIDSLSPQALALIALALGATQTRFASPLLLVPGMALVGWALKALW